MKNDFDIEDTLKRFRHEPDSRVKRSILGRFSQRAAALSGPGFLRRPVPLYLAAAQIVIALCLGFFVARSLPLSEKVSISDDKGSTRMEPAQTPAQAVAAELEWEVAPNDIL
ncbi:MAG: hypothetical protein JSW50_16150 [Candidatus Latescibacterota bacterium]|nr:MAG: hypothetical protein JSW50_16150 [Candidatus Latescibacterota bacterium]